MADQPVQDTGGRRGLPAAPRPRAVLAPGDLHRPSTPQELECVRAALGGRFDAYVRTVTTLLSQRPGLRGSAPAVAGALVTELVATCATLAADHTPVSAALRENQPIDDPALIVCAANGVRRLGTVQGPVYCDTPPDIDVSAVYWPGQLICEPGFVTAAADHRMRLSGRPEVVIWSVTARRLDGIVPNTRAHEVLFGAGTSFAVLAVDPADGNRPPRVYLRELPPGTAQRDRGEALLARLREATARRDAIPEDERPNPPHPARLTSPPGLPPTRSGGQL